MAHINDYDAIVIGGGFFGCALALQLGKSLGQRVVILEAATDLLQRASYTNQARVHAGYHYPRSFLTALRSQVNFSRFISDFQDCVDDSFDMYYAIARNFSNVTAAQFRLFCQRIGAPIEPAPVHIKSLFDDTFIEDVYLVREYAFDASKLKSMMVQQLIETGVEIKVNAEATKVWDIENSQLAVQYVLDNQTTTTTAGQVFNCTYSRINQLLAASELPLIPLKHELTELALVEVPDHLKNLGVTVMCGPFFSVMPFPPRGVHTLSHVRYTPHCGWQTDVTAYKDSYELFNELPKSTNYHQMIKDAQRYLPSLKDCRYVDSMWEIKTVLPRSEIDDSRPILLKRNHGLQNLNCIIGAKVDNIYDMLESFPGPQL